MLPRLHDSGASPDLPTSMPPYRYTFGAPGSHLRRSIPPYLSVATPSAQLQSSIPLYLHVPSPAVRLQTSGAPYLHVCAHAARVQLPHTSTPPHVCTPTRASETRSSMPPCRRTFIEPPDLHATMPPCRYTCIAPPDLQTSRLLILPRLYACSTPPAHHTFPSLRLQRVSRYPDHHASTSALLQCSSIASELHTSIHPRLHACSVPATRLRGPIPPSLHDPGPHRASKAPYLHASTSTRRHRDFSTSYRHTTTERHLQRASRAPCLLYLHLYTLTESLQNSRSPELNTSASPGPLRAPRTLELHTSMLPHLHACIAPLDFQNSIPPRR